MFQFNHKWFCENCFVASPSSQDPCPSCGWPGTESPVYAALPAGTVLENRYIVGRVLGKGGFGITYLAYDSTENRRVAIKEYLPDTLAQRHTGDTTVSVFSGEREQAFLNGEERFFEEAKTVARFNGNPNIISVYESFKENNTAYFVMEYLEGCDLRTWYEQNQGLSYPDAVRILNNVTDALLIVHSMRILHRDISPDNIFLCDDGTVKLIDFGAAKQVVGASTQSLSVILKPGYAPYEQYQRRSSQGPWTDIYALGATFYYMLTGRLIDDAMTRRDHEALDLSLIPLEIQPVLTKMLAVQPADRYQTVIELKHALAANHIDEASAQYFTLPPAGVKSEAIPASAYYDDGYGDPVPPSQGVYSIPEAPPQTYSKPYGAAYEEQDDPEEERRSRRRKTAMLTFGILGLLLIAAILGVLLSGGRGRKPAETSGLITVESISLSDSALVLRLGESAVLHASVQPENAVNPSVSWSSDDEKVAEVDSNGKVVAKGAGTCTITATVGGDVTAQCSVTVENPGKLTLNTTRLALYTGDTEQLTSEYKGSPLTWSSDSEEVATVSENGLVTAVGAGTAIITASADGFSASCVVTVKAAVDAIELSETLLEMTLGDEQQLEVTLYPSEVDPDDVELTWESSDSEVVTVKDGLLKAAAPGQARITVTAGEAEATCIVKVAAAITEIRLDADTLTLEVGETYTCKATVLPDAVVDPFLKWSSSDTSVASVQDGVITAIGAGSATITVTGDDVTASCNVVVTAATVSGERYTMSTPVGSITGTYTGQWSNGKPDGEGTLTVSQPVSTIVGSSYASGDKLKGSWVNGLLGGKGRIEYVGGEVYEGEFSNGLRNGSGRLVYADGSVLSGKWVNDVFMG